MARPTGRTAAAHESLYEPVDAHEITPPNAHDRPGDASGGFASGSSARLASQDNLSGDAPAFAAARREARLLAVLGWTMIAGILSQKFSLLLTSQTPLQLVLCIEYLAFAWLAWQGKVHINALSLMLTMAFLVLATLANLFTRPAFTSIVYVYAVYLPFALRVRLSPGGYMRYLDMFQVMALFTCLWVMLDWGFQFLGWPMPNVEHHLFEFFRYFNFNYIQPLEWGSRWYKPNAFFYLEVSFVAQTIATALIFEICLFRRMTHIAVYAVSLLATFSGTGMTLVLLCLPAMVAYLRPKLIAVALALAPITVVTALGIGLIDNAVQRTQEFDREGSSGNQRFIGQVEAVRSAFEADPRDVIFGIGAGQILQNGKVVWNPITKVTVEYGIFVCAIYLAMIAQALFGKRKPFIVSYALLMQFLLLNGGFLVPVIVFTIFMLSGVIEIASPGRELLPVSPAPWSARQR